MSESIGPRMAPQTSHLVKVLLIGAGLAAMPLAANAAPHIDKSVRTGSGLHEIVHDHQTDQLFVTATGRKGEDDTSAVLQLDPESLKVTRRIATPARAFGLALNNATDTLYTTNTGDRSVSVINAKTGKVMKTIRLENEQAPVMEGKQLTRPREAVVDEAHNRVYISGVSRDGMVWVLDGSSNKLMGNIEGIGDTPAGMALDVDNQRLYVTLLESDAVVEINLDNHSVVRRFEVDGNGPVSVALDRQRQRLLVANQGSGDMDVINLDSGQVMKRIDTGAGALNVTLDSKDNRIYVANHGAGTVTVLDADDYDRLATLHIGLHPDGLTVDSKSHVAWVTSRGSGKEHRSDDAEHAREDGEQNDTVSRILP
ncbi:YncE family protein [Kushneria phosphatilytica]|uniref:YncE family protein n=1 Tax=Kushneria phosphatilytica TaxID=657387 RepID=A0A1S1NUE9_9GAMM|nr:YncE family protein [Kushneria phosphatilytica]OHV13803.1 hypothetical protein BH688_00090 [Kushneria phosphatilytica]QEL10355.1 YncE family protein [Kushneria phosphatilytica]